MSEHFLRDYLSKHSVMIVDPVSSARGNLASALTKLGALRQKMSLIGSMDEAVETIEKTKPVLIFTDYTIGSGSGLDLIQNQKASHGKTTLKETLFVLVTANASQSAVARAAEEDVDTFIIKPYTLDTLKKALEQTVQSKIHPSKYLQLIEQGKQELFAGRTAEAIRFFSLAMYEHSEPTLACFYYGQAEFMQSAVENAKGKYNQGLSYNKIHYKCLVGLFDLLHSQKKYVEAYEVIRVIAQYFPANPKRLATVLRLAIMTENFMDIDGYYRVYLQITERSDDLTKYMCSALLVTGKFFLRKKNPKRALDVFEAAAVSCAGRTHFLLYMIEALVDFKMGAEAEKFLARLAKVGTESHDYLSAKFLLSTLGGDVKESVNLGRNLIRDGVENPIVYEKMIEQSGRAGYLDSVEELFKFACERWPDREVQFTFALESAKINCFQIQSHVD